MSLAIFLLAMYPELDSGFHLTYPWVTRLNRSWKSAWWQRV